MLRTPSPTFLLATAYAAVAKLAAAGIVDGYPDGTYKGDRTMTRYEMAQIVAKALAKGAIGADDRLVGEFADETR